MKNNKRNIDHEKSAAEIFEIVEAKEGDVNLAEARQGCITVQVPKDKKAGE